MNIHSKGYTMRMTQESMWKFRRTLRWIKNLLGWMLLILCFMSIGWFMVYLIAPASQQ